MNNYAILRHSNKKLHSFASIDTAEAHNRRDIDVPNADPAGRHVRLIGKGRNASDILKARLKGFGIKPRKNAVLANEYVLTFSPEMKDKISIKDWVKANVEFMKAEHGKEGILTVDLHLDETTPHLHVLVAPLTEKEIRGKMRWRLAGKDFWGSPQLLRERQNRYSEAMKKFGLERGLKGSKAAHKAIKEYYSIVNQAHTTAEKDLAQLDARLGDIEAHQKPSVFNLAKAWNALFDTTKSIYDMLKSQIETSAMLRTNRDNLASELKTAREAVSRVNQRYKNSDLSKLETSLQAALDKAYSLESDRDNIIEEAKKRLNEKSVKIEELSNQNSILNGMLDRYQERDRDISYDR